MNNTANEIAALVGVTVVGPESMKIVRARVYGMGLSNVCGRCGGCGRYSFNGSHSICYGCDGRGEVAIDLTKKSTLEAVKTAIAAGKLTEYHAARAARAVAKKALVPLYRQCEAAYSACYSEILAASGFSDRNTSQAETHAYVMSVAFNLICENSDLNSAAHAVDLARRFNDLDIDQGVLFAEVILKDLLAKIEAVRETVARLDRDTLRSQCYPAQVCKVCGQTVEFMASAKPGKQQHCGSLRQYAGERCDALVTCGG
jgi:hypothetical protein